MRLYNNELLGVLSLQEVLSIAKEIPLSNTMLTLPIVFHKKSLDYLANKKTNVISVQDLMLTKPELILSINKRYYHFLPSSINCVSLCIENGVADLIKNNLVFKKN